MSHLRRTFLVPVELEEAFAAELWAAGTLGVELREGSDGRVRIDAYFGAEAAPLSLDGWTGIEATGDEAIPDTDWLAAYRERAVPFEVGRTLFVDPREPEEGSATPLTPPDGRRLLRLPARGAFGIGSHESTRLVLEILEELDVSGLDVLDVGTGTGILAFVALLGGARSAVAYDNDPAAPFYARDNARLNGFDGDGLKGRAKLFAGSIAALGSSARFDLALVNVVPEQILPDLPALAGRLRPGGGMILSGILRERGDEMLAAVAGLGFAERARRVDGEWIAFYVQRGSGA
jgi:ribosomal protein L11 methyltransferase